MSILDLGRRRTTIVVLVLLSITLVTLDLRGSGVIDGARETALDVTAPLRGIGGRLVQPIENVWNGVTNYDEVRRENERLRERLEVQEGASIAAEAQVREYQDLLAANNLPYLGDIPTVTAKVVSQPASNFDLTIELNQGERAGIRVGMPVVTPAGLVGRVTRVTPTRSVVRLITDPELNVAVKVSGRPEVPPGSPTAAASTPAGGPGTTAVGTTATTSAATAAPPALGSSTIPPQPSSVPPPASLPPPPVGTAAPATSVADEALVTRELGIMHGEGRGRPLAVDFIDADTDVSVGDPVVTSGVDQSLSPADIPVGRVSSVKRTTGSFQLDVRVEPAADLDNLTFVKVLLYVPEV